METQKYDLDYFIKKFEAIPEEKWITNGYGKNGVHCAYGHCGADDNGKYPEEARALNGLSGCVVEEINDGFPQYLRYGSTPRTRVINFLKELKAKKEADELSDSLFVSDKGKLSFPLSEQLKQEAMRNFELWKITNEVSGGEK